MGPAKSIRNKFQLTSDAFPRSGKAHALEPLSHALYAWTQSRHRFAVAPWTAGFFFGNGNVVQGWLSQVISIVGQFLNGSIARSMEPFKVITAPLPRPRDASSHAIWPCRADLRSA
ncbi:unnamed protein product [Penicillium roqueforti FM164]|uniref:Genomic scaffold, ProqFM164S01 n=1 Tax=Penicillium roqueforti (strain FM164) TaxID=1365484 RepID=W6PU73_PENRF|nr:unnamed protein product [Penicillium roqueforti FM164]